MRKRVGVVLAIVCMFFMFAVSAGAEQLFATDVTVASEGCTLLGIEGKYIVDTNAALKRINEIRYEACKEGVINPSTGEKLTMADYVPIKWSADLEYIARIRAAEASLTMDHKRTNGESCFAISSPSGVYSWGEVLAWDSGSSVITGINLWYSEKRDWVKQNPNAVTGHYTQMIAPENLYVGLGVFCTNSSECYKTTAGEFAGWAGLPESSGKSTESGIQVLEVNNQFLSGKYTISGSLNGKAGDRCSLDLTTGTRIEDYWGGIVEGNGLLVMEHVTWSSSNNSIASVDSDGCVQPNYCGKAQITAQSDSGMNAAASFEVTHTEVSTPTVPATCKKTGLTSGTHCSVCQKVIKKQKSTPKTSHKWDAGVVKKAATYRTYGTKTLKCKVCGVTKTQKIPKVKIKKGAVFTVGSLKYRITDSRTNGKGTVALAGVSGKKDKYTTIKVGDTVKIAGAVFSIQSIGTGAFKGCVNLTSVSIGNRITSIGKDAFYGCRSLNQITLKSKKIKTISMNAVKGINSEAVIKVPASQKKKYKKLFNKKTGFLSTMIIKS